MFYAAKLRKHFPFHQAKSATDTPCNIEAVQHMSAETAAKLRILLSEDFSAATSWQNLANMLLSKGYYMRFRDSDILIHDCHSHVRICSTQFLGYPANSLEDRFSPEHQHAMS